MAATADKISAVDAHASLPLFPLPGHVLLPGLPVPLHVFEPRYRALIRDLLERPDGQRLLAVPRIRPGHEAEAAGRPPMCEIVAIARLTAASAMPDGRFQVAVVGEGRWRLRELTSEQPYRLGELRRLPEPDPDPDFAAKVAAAVRRHLGCCPAVDDDLAAQLDVARHPATIVLDRLAALTLVDPDLRQRYLETTRPCCRLRVLEGVESRCGQTSTQGMN